LQLHLLRGENIEIFVEFLHGTKIFAHFLAESLFPIGHFMGVPLTVS
jgi:hypothetical protein